MCTMWEGLNNGLAKLRCHLEALAQSRKDGSRVHTRPMPNFMIMRVCRINGTAPLVPS